MKIGSGIQNLILGIHKQHGDNISLFYFLKDSENWLSSPHCVHHGRRHSEIRSTSARNLSAWTWWVPCHWDLSLCKPADRMDNLGDVITHTETITGRWTSSQRQPIHLLNETCKWRSAKPIIGLQARWSPEWASDGKTKASRLNSFNKNTDRPLSFTSSVRSQLPSLRQYLDCLYPNVGWLIERSGRGLSCVALFPIVTTRSFPISSSVKPIVLSTSQALGIHRRMYGSKSGYVTIFNWKFYIASNCKKNHTMLLTCPFSAECAINFVQRTKIRVLELGGGSTNKAPPSQRNHCPATSRLSTQAHSRSQVMNWKGL